MQYRRVSIAGLGYTLPEALTTTDEIEGRLEPLYTRLRLPAGRLELMTGIRARRFWPVEMPVSDVSIQSGERAIAASGIDVEQIGALIHGSVCRDHLEPATASRVHRELGLGGDCLVYDVSNACLGILNGMLQIADLIELGRIRAGLVVGTENGAALVENTIAALNADVSLSRSQIKSSIASLTIGSASVAVVLCDRELIAERPQLLGGKVMARTGGHQLCQSVGLETIMHTDSDRLMREGVATAAETFGPFLDELAWRSADIDRVICHQVGAAHRKLLYETLGLDLAKDFSTVELLGNTGSAALPVTLALAAQEAFLESDHRVALLGIGSGIHCLMLGLQWQACPVVGG